MKIPIKGENHLIHIVNGDVVGKKLNHLEKVIVWREMYDVGPLNLMWSNEELYQKRASFFEKKMKIPSSFFVKNCMDQYKQLKELSPKEEIVLWFEHDRYDQIMMIYLITELTLLGFQDISLVSIDQYPGIEPFHGLGQLTTNQLIDLLPQKKAVSTKQIEEAKTVWKAYQSNDPVELEKWIKRQTHELPFLKQAMEAHLSYFPSSETGLNEVEHIALSLISVGKVQFNQLFNKVSRVRINDGLSDFYFASLLNELIAGKYPLITTDSNLPNYEHPISTATLDITKNGVDVLNGKISRFELIGMDWWIGGVHIIR